MEANNRENHRGVWVLKLSSVVRIIQTHANGNDNEFTSAVGALADEEERKGNRAGAAAIRDAGALTNKGQTGKTLASASTFSSSSGSLFGPSGAKAAAATLPPKDRDTALDLFEWRVPDVSLDSLVLPEAQRRVIEGFVVEQRGLPQLEQLGLEASQRLLLTGPPGCGKTRTALAIATELEIPMAYVRLDGLVSSFLGQTGANIRRIFDSVRNQRVVLFLDEIDAIAKKRDDHHELGELKRVVITLLQNFDNLGSSVIVIAATNHSHLLDPALWRRFNVVVTLGLPGEDERKELLQRLLSRFPVADFQLRTLVRATEGLSPANIEEMVIQAAKRALVINQSPKMRAEDLYTALVYFMAGAVIPTGEQNDSALLSVAHDLHIKGVPLRVIAEGTGIPRSTLHDKFKGGVALGR